MSLNLMKLSEIKTKIKELQKEEEAIKTNIKNFIKSEFNSSTGQVAEDGFLVIVESRVRESLDKEKVATFLTEDQLQAVTKKTEYLELSLKVK